MIAMFVALSLLSLDRTIQQHPQPECQNDLHWPAHCPCINGIDGNFTAFGEYFKAKIVCGRVDHPRATGPVIGEHLHNRFIQEDVQRKFPVVVFQVKWHCRAGYIEHIVMEPDGDGAYPFSGTAQSHAERPGIARLYFDDHLKHIASYILNDLRTPA
jgi:hypothetical protein